MASKMIGRALRASQHTFGKNACCGGGYLALYVLSCMCLCLKLCIPARSCFFSLFLLPRL